MSNYQDLRDEYKIPVAHNLVAENHRERERSTYSEETWEIIETNEIGVEVARYLKTDYTDHKGNKIYYKKL
ncbi:MAG: hypothetical protein EOM53_01075 [Alphaproteobacteria bacterium]|nr:hypothetical protein [Alphaproteobacteria bacterium]